MMTLKNANSQKSVITQPTEKYGQKMDKFISKGHIKMADKHLKKWPTLVISSRVEFCQLRCLQQWQNTPFPYV